MGFPIIPIIPIIPVITHVGGAAAGAGGAAAAGGISMGLFLGVVIGIPVAVVVAAYAGKFVYNFVKNALEARAQRAEAAKPGRAYKAAPSSAYSAFSSTPQTALQQAAARGDTALIAQLLSYGASVTAPGVTAAKPITNGYNASSSRKSSDTVMEAEDPKNSDFSQGLDHDMPKPHLIKPRLIKLPEQQAQ